MARSLLLLVVLLVTVACSDGDAPDGPRVPGSADPITDEAPAADDASTPSASDRHSPVLRDERPRVDTRARLDVTGVPENVVLVHRFEPLAGVVVAEPGEMRVVVHADGVRLRSMTLELRAGETLVPDLDWVEGALAYRRRHGPGEGVHRCTCERVREHAIDWLVTHRSTDGAWRADTFDQRCPPASMCGPGVVGVSPVETTSLALLALLGIGETHTGGRYGEAVRSALGYLVAEQDDEGRFGDRARSDATFVQAVGTVALTEHLGLTGSRRHRAATLSAVDALLALRRPGLGWTRGADARRPDAETTAWAAIAIASAAMAEVDAGRRHRTELVRDLEVFGDPGASLFEPRLGALLTLARMMVGAELDDPAVASGVERVAALRPGESVNGDPVFLWAGAAVMRRGGGEDAWEKWSRGLEGLLERPLTLDWELLEHRPPPEADPGGVRLGRLRAMIYRQLAYEIAVRYGRVLGASAR